MGLFDSSSSQSSTSGIRVAPATALENQTTGTIGTQYGQMENIVNAGPGANAAQAGMEASQQYADLLGQFGKNGGLQAQQQAALGGYQQMGNQFYGGLLNQQAQASAQQAAKMGRSTNDAVLQNKLAQTRAGLVGQFAVQNAMQSPFQQAQFMGQRADVLQGLSSQAMSNRQALIGLGSNLREADRSYRINTGERYNNSTTTQNPSMMANLGAVAGLAGAAFGAYGKFAGASGGAGGAGGAMQGGQSAAANASDADFYGSHQGLSSLGPMDSTGGMNSLALAKDINANDPILQQMLAQRGGGQTSSGGGFMPQVQQFNPMGQASVPFSQPQASNPFTPSGQGFFSQQNINDIRGGY